MKRYRDYNSYLRELFGERVQKISLDAGFTCPNRDGSMSQKGCIYCDSKGSGSGAKLIKDLSIEEQEYFTVLEEILNVLFPPLDPIWDYFQDY